MRHVRHTIQQLAICSWKCTKCGTTYDPNYDGPCTSDQCKPKSS